MVRPSFERARHALSESLRFIKIGRTLLMLYKVEMYAVSS